MLLYLKSKFAMKHTVFFFFKVTENILLSILVKRAFDTKSILKMPTMNQTVTLES